VRRRIAALGVNGFAAYRERLEGDPQEWQALDRFCHITMSRFFRDRGIFNCLRTSILPAIAECARLERRPARCWSAGCASGEEPYSIRFLWDLGVSCAGPNTGMSIVATDINDALLARAREGCYGRTSLREIPPKLIPHAFERVGPRFCVQHQHREGVMFLKQGLRSGAPSGPFDIILCRYLAFTYFARSLQQKVLGLIAERLIPNGFLVVGSHEQLADARFVSVGGIQHVFTKLN
jgi:chemotaxis protein methyltransferase CheR